jgi:hypothetical protein
MLHLALAFRKHVDSATTGPRQDTATIHGAAADNCCIRAEKMRIFDSASGHELPLSVQRVSTP